MEKYPKIHFRVEGKQDLFNAVNFILKGDENNQLVERFLHPYLRFILQSGFSRQLRKKILIAYTNHFYKIRRSEINEGFKLAVKNWRKVESKYFKLVDGLFNNRAWSKGNYRAFASIWLVYPRYIKYKVFYFPFTHRIDSYANKVIAHEMLHFIFFDYIEEKYGLSQDSRLKGRPKDYVWQFSEVFNTVIENWEPYKKITGIEAKPYDGLETLYRKVKKQWQKTQKIDLLLDKFLKI
jgi:hypothetical protein